MTYQTVLLRSQFQQRISGPGGLYNLGNALGLVGGVSFHVAAAMAVAGSGVGHGADALVDYFVGSLGATAITVAMLIFFWSGDQYHKAWAHGAPPDGRLNRLGDVSSGWGALALGVGLFLMGHPVLAATAGLMHAAGKFGSALPERVQARMPFGQGVFRLTVVASRIPALVAVLLQLQAAMAAGESQSLAASGLLLLCYLLWLKADVALMRS
jgi:hypothetical protein